MSGALVEPQAIISSVGVGNATEAGSTPFSDVRGAGDGLVQRAEEVSVLEQHDASCSSCTRG